MPKDPAAITLDQLPALRRRSEERRKLAIRLMVDEGKGPNEVSQLLGVSRESLRRWVLRFQAGGAKALATSPNPRGPAYAVTEEQAAQLAKEARAQELTSLADIVRLAKRLRIKASRSAIRRRLVVDGFWPE